MTAERAAQLAHDVGKYVARIARNVAPDAPVPAPLVPLLAKDLYERPGGGRPAARFRELADLSVPRLAEVDGWLTELDALEPDVRAGDDAACRRACALARDIDDALRAHAAEAGA